MAKHRDSFLSNCSSSWQSYDAKRTHVTCIWVQIESWNRWLITKDAGGNIIEDACNITYPGSSDIVWWDTDQLIKQVDKVVAQL